MRRVLLVAASILTLASVAIAGPAWAQDNLPYTTYSSVDQLLKGRDARYAPLTRVSDPGDAAHRAYTGFFFYQVLQFDCT